MMLKLKLCIEYEIIYLIYQVEQVNYQHRKWVANQDIVLARMILLLVKISCTYFNERFLLAFLEIKEK